MYLITIEKCDSVQDAIQGKKTLVCQGTIDTKKVEETTDKFDAHVVLMRDKVTSPRFLEGRVFGFDGGRLKVWDLALHALAACLGGRNTDVVKGIE